MNEMVERIKRALLEEYNNLIPDEAFNDDECWRKSAKRIITEMRQPTEAMLDECYSVHPDSDGEGSCWFSKQNALECWNVMIDAALK